MNTNDSGTPSKTNRSPFRRWDRRLSVAVMAAAIVLAAFYAFENARAARAWNRYRAAVEARGQSLKLPPRTPEMEARLRAGEACAHDLKAFAEDFEKSDRLYLQSLPSSGYAEREDLVAWGKLFRAAKAGQTNQTPQLEKDLGNASEADRAAAAALVLEILQEQDPFIERVRAACQRPELVYPFGYDRPIRAKGDMPPCPRIFDSINVCRHLRVRITAELALGRTGEALRNLQLMLDLSDALRIEKGLIAAIGRLACRSLALKPVWTALADRGFSPTELRDLQRMLEGVPVLEDVPQVLIAERNQMLHLLTQAESKGGYPTHDLNVMKPFRYLPRGWLTLEKLNYCRAMDDYLAAAFSDSGQHVRLRQVAELAETTRNEAITHWLQLLWRPKVMWPLIMPRLAEFAASTAANQVMSDQIRIACGLEQYYLQHGRYPGKLEALVPAFIPELPKDPLSADDYHYALDKNGRYRIWSVGENGKDDGGVPGDTPHVSPGHPDWVWYYPES